MMSDKPSIAVLGGTGNIGPGLVMRWAHAGYEVMVGSREKEKAQETARMANEKLGIDSVQGMENQDAARAADICVLTVAAKAHEAALRSLKEAVQGKILVDATARVTFPDATAPQPPSAGRIAQEMLGDGATVVMAFQNVPSAALKKNLGEKIDSHVLVCADDTKAAETVIQLIEAAGMKGYYAGGLDNGFVVEGLTALLIHMNRHYGGHGTIQVAGINKNKERD
jgi:hypothetical protein